MIFSIKPAPVVVQLIVIVDVVVVVVVVVVVAVVINFFVMMIIFVINRPIVQVCIDVLARVLCASRELVFYEEYFADGALTDVSTANAKTSTKSKAYHLNAYRQRNLQWRTVAQVIDRIFFIIYLIGMALSLIFVFPK